MSHSVLIQGPLNFYLFSFLRAPFVLSSQVHFFFRSSGSVFQRIRKRQTLPIRDCRPNCGEMEKHPVLAMFYVLWTTFLSIWCWMSPFLLFDLCLDLCKSELRTTPSAGKGTIFPLLQRHRTIWRHSQETKRLIVLYAYEYTWTNMYTVTHKFKCLCLRARDTEDDNMGNKAWGIAQY